MAGHAGGVQWRPAVFVGDVGVGTGFKDEVHRCVLLRRARLQRNRDVARGGAAGEGDEGLPAFVLFGQHARATIEDAGEGFEIAARGRVCGGFEVV